MSQIKSHARVVLNPIIESATTSGY